MTNINIDKLSSSTKNIVYLVILVGQAVLAYAQIYSNQSDISQLKIDIQKEFLLQSHRSDKRYKRAMELGKDHETRLRRLEQTITYIRGKENY